MSDDALATDVMIVGGGPIGMTLAIDLDALGIRCVIANTETDTRWHPKGATQNARTMEHYRRLGISRQLRSLGLPQDFPLDVGYFTRLTGWELARLSLPSEREKMEVVANAGPVDQVPEPLLRCNQMYSEAFFLRHIQTLDRVDVRFGWQCLDFAEHKDGVTAEIEDVNTGRRQTVRALYLVGCDGGRGLTRRKLGVRYGGESSGSEYHYLDGRMVSTYVNAPGFLRRIPHRLCWQYWTVNTDVRCMSMVLDGSDDVTFGTMLRGPEDQIDEGRIARAFLAAYGSDIELKFYDHRPWTAGHALVADSFGAGRVLLCGDAAHLFTPTGGFGLNTGVDDAINLGWKLAASVQGWGGADLLASYEVERRAIALRNTAAGRQFVHSIGATPISAAINEDSPAGEAARRKAGDYLSGFGEEFASLGVQLGARYDGSPIISGDGTSPPPDDLAVYTPSATPGGRAPHLWLKDRSSLYDQCDQGFTLLRFRGTSADTRPIEAAARSRGVPLKVVEIDHPEGRDLYQRDLALIRPDLIVAWRGNRLPGDCAALIERCVGGPAA
ncbi:MAG TPA: FAD-dependent oxidoreductase [Stellaceae bacterium]|nr:FAD-dependent oxidoreductase [Stellaceae bacterium]